MKNHLNQLRQRCYEISLTQEYTIDDITLNCSFTYDNVTNEYTRISDYTPGTFSANSDISGVGVSTCHTARPGAYHLLLFPTNAS